MLSQKIDHQLVDLAWSLWTELGVRGNLQRHQECLIDLEILIILTALIADVDPRLRDEALDWCSRNHHFVSISRLKALLKTLTPVSKSYSIFAATLNSVCKAAWPMIIPSEPLKLKCSGKSSLLHLESPSLLNLRLRAIFGAGVRADLITYFLTQKADHFTASEVTEIGYSKRSLVDILENFVQAGFFEVFTTRNIRNYRFVKREQLAKMGTLPEAIPSWRHFLELLIPLRECVQRTETKGAGIKMIDIRNTLKILENKLLLLNITPPPFDADALHYCNSFSEWFLQLVRSYADGNFGKPTKILDTLDAAKRINIQFKGLFDNINSLKTISHEHSKQTLFENYKNSFKRHLDHYIPRLLEDDQKSIRKFQDELLSMVLDEFIPSLQQQVLIRVAAILAKYFSE